MAEPLVLSRVERGIGELTLNRPKALNSLNTEMVASLLQTYRAWAAPGSGVRAVLLTGAGGKAFCAGGDVKSVALMVLAGRRAEAMAFFRQEYLADAAISQLPLPHVALLDGIVMGGGAGVSMHGHFRVATERTVFAMPEVAIGLFPDVGMMAVLPHLPGELGAYLALTGARLTGAQVKEAGLATHFIPSSHLHLVKQRLQGAGEAAADLSQVNRLLCGVEEEATAAAAAAQPAAAQHGAAGGGRGGGGGGLLDKLPVIERCFGRSSVCEVVEALRAEAAERQFCDDALQQLQRGSPLSAALTLRYYRRARAGAWGVLEALEQDAVLCGHLMAGDGDFAEGVRARLIDKDDAPRWKHAGHEQVPQQLVESFFSPRSQEDVLDLRGRAVAPAARL